MANINNLVDQQAEAGVVATAIMHPEFLYDVSRYMSPSYFYDTSAGCIYWAVETLLNKGVKHIDAYNISAMLNSDEAVKNKIEEYNINSIQDYIDACQPVVRDSVEEFKMVVARVVMMSYKRTLLRFTQSIQRCCEDKHKSVNDLEDYVYNGLNKISDRYVLGEESVELGDKVDDLWERMVSRRNTDGSYGIPSFIPSLDKYFSYVPGEILLIAAVTGQGKSSFLLNEAIHCLEMGVGVLYIDTELTDEVFMVRFLSHMSGVSFQDIRKGNYNEEQAEKIEKGKEYIKEHHIIHEHMTDFSKSKIRQLVRKWQAQADIGILIFDYIKLEEGGGAAENSTELGKKANFLKNSISIDLDIPVATAAQLNEDTDKIADSKKVLQVLDTLIIWRPKTQEEIQEDGLACGNYAIEVHKNRNGASNTDYIDVAFDGSKMFIKEAPQHSKKDERGETPFD